MHTLPLRLIIQDEQDLLVASAHLEGAVLQVRNMTYLPAQKRFACIVQRADMAHSTGLHFDYVEKVQTQNWPSDIEAITCLACIFEPTDAPAGIITLYFDGAPRIRLFVECLEAGMCDIYIFYKWWYKTIMTALVIDSYKLISTLKSKGFSEEQANGIREAIEEIDLSSLATKADIADLKVEVFKWAVPTLLGHAGLIVALMKAFG